MRRVLFFGAVVVLVAVLASPALATPPTTIQPLIEPRQVKLKSPEVVRVKGKASCPAGWHVLEAFVSVTQDGFTSQVGFTIPCDHKLHLWKVEVRSEESRYREGRARVTTFLLVERDDVPGITLMTGTVRRVVLR
jgi:hypothetical protein